MHSMGLQKPISQMVTLPECKQLCLHGLVQFLLAARDEDMSTLFDEKFCRS